MATVVWSLGVLNQNPGQRRRPSRSRARDRAGRARGVALLQRPAATKVCLILLAAREPISLFLRR